MMEGLHQVQHPEPRPLKGKIGDLILGAEVEAESACFLDRVAVLLCSH
jgi:hypothetical protein